MKKKIIALAVAAAFSAPAFADTANVTVYGRAHVSLDSNSGNAAETATTGTKNGLNLTSNSSRLGVKGSEDLGDGWKAVYQYETQINTQGDTGGTSLFSVQRDTYVGVASGFGTLVAGRLPLANQYVGDSNFFSEKVGDVGAFTAGGLGGYGGLLAVPSRASRAIGYVSPSFGGVTITAGYVPNSVQSLLGVQNNVGKASTYSLRAAYDSNGIFAAANYINIGVAGLGLTAVPTAGVPGAAGIAQTGAKAAITSLAAGYDFGVAKFRAQYVNTDLNAQAAFSVNPTYTGMKQSVISLGGQYNIGDSDALKLQYAKAGKVKLSGADAAGTDASMWAFGYDHKLSKRTTLYAAYAKVKNGTLANFSATGYSHGGVGIPGSNTAAANGNDPSALSLGMIHDF